MVKMLMVGANVTMMCSVLLREGPEHMRLVERRLRTMDGRSRIRISAPDAGQHEPVAMRRSFCVSSAHNTCGQ